jgi:hypothetical protein
MTMTFIVQVVFGKTYIFLIAVYEECTRAIHPHNGLVFR